jgi:hypothetical protein
MVRCGARAIARINLGPTAPRSRSVTVFSLLLATRRTDIGATAVLAQTKESDLAQREVTSSHMAAFVMFAISRAFALSRVLYCPHRREL